MPPRKPNWDRIEQEYIIGDNSVTLETLAVTFGVHPDTVRRHAAIGFWGKKRKEHRHLIATMLGPKREDVADAQATAIMASIRECNATLGRQDFEISDLANRTVLDLMRKALESEDPLAALTDAMPVVRVLMTATGIGQDKYRQMTEQATARPGTENEFKKYTPAEVEEALADIRKLVG